MGPHNIVLLYFCAIIVLFDSFILSFIEIIVYGGNKSWDIKNHIIMPKHETFKLNETIHRNWQILKNMYLN